jgi:hypothetical protein
MLNKVFAKLGQKCWDTVRAAGLVAVWRRAPITTVTITLVIGFWLYDYVSVSSAATASAPRPSIAVENLIPGAIRPAAESQPTVAQNDTSKKIHRMHHRKTAHAAFRRKRIGRNEVDYVANDVTIRLFTPGSTLTRPSRSSRQRNIGKDVTVRNFASETATVSKTRPGSTMTQAAQRSALVTK